MLYCFRIPRYRAAPTTIDRSSAEAGVPVKLTGRGVCVSIPTMKTMKPSIRKYIGIHPGICHGKPCFRGTRIPVSLILQMIEGGDSIDDILRGYPMLSRQAIQAALYFASQAVENTRLSPRVLAR